MAESRRRHDRNSGSHGIKLSEDFSRIVREIGIIDASAPRCRNFLREKKIYPTASEKRRPDAAIEKTRKFRRRARARLKLRLQWQQPQPVAVYVRVRLWEKKQASQQAVSRLCAISLYHRVIGVR